MKNKKTGAGGKSRMLPKSGVHGLEEARQPTPEEIRLARKNGYSTRKPSKKNVKPTLESANAYTVRYNKWADMVRTRAARQLKKEADELTGKAAKIAVGKL